jgi:hypothetical protein
MAYYFSSFIFSYTWNVIFVSKYVQLYNMLILCPFLIFIIVLTYLWSCVLLHTQELY